jgi:RTA1 like protein
VSGAALCVVCVRANHGDARIVYFAPEISRIPPKLFYWIFIPCDIFCLVLQAAGGALSTTSSGSSQVGVNLALAGLSMQVVFLVVFCCCFADYMIRYLHHRKGKRFSGRVKLFFGFLALAILLILARCAYRVDELSQGYSGPLIHNEGLFIALEGV